MCKDYKGIQRNRLTRSTWLSVATGSLLLLMGGIALSRRLVLAQDNSGSLIVTVNDVSGAAVPDALVKLTNKETGSTRILRTGFNGSSTIQNLPVGTYDVFVSRSGFSTAQNLNVHVSAGQTVTTNLNLAIGAAAGPVVQTLPRITGRKFLLGISGEDKGYGLYSYMLLGSQAVDPTHERYLAFFQEYLNFPETVELEQYVSKRQLNITYVPLSTPLVAPPTSPDSILKDYNFDRAEALLAKIPGGPYLDGPYIVSYEVPLSKAAALPRDGYLFQDLSSVPQEIIILWVREFMSQASQNDYWKKRNGPEVALKLRTAIAQLAAGIDPAKKSVQEWQSILAIIWRPTNSGK